MTTLHTLLSLCALAGGCAATTEARDADEPLQIGKVDPSPKSANAADAAVGSADEMCCGDGFSCCDGACAPDTTIESMCASSSDFVASFQRGADDCFSLGFSFGYSNWVGYAYTASGELKSCRLSGDGHGAKVDGDVEFCPGDGGYGCIVCAVDGPGVDLENWLEATRWCDESDDLPFSLEGIDRDGTGVAGQ